MLTRRCLAVSAAVLALTLGASSAAQAAPRGHNAERRIEAMCRRADHRLAELQRRQEQAEGRQAALQADLDLAIAAGKTHRAERLQAQLDQTQRKLDEIAAEMADAQAFIDDNCVPESPQFS